MNDAEIVERICKETARANRNNVTRTEAYHAIWLRRPELHWALLAHLVSRNGGWNMTDLKGGLLPRLFDARKAEHFYLMLERANALIFQDAYPQLRLYEESVHLGRSLFHLLPSFHVSAFMHPIWEQFCVNRNIQLLTVALIVNEQNYIENRVIGRPEFRKHAIDTVLFKAQSLFQFNQIVFPYTVASNYVAPFSLARTKPLRLAGKTIEHFAALDERIEMGKTLYAILYGSSAIHRRIAEFVKAVPHTGSRADYWPHLFTRTEPAASKSGLLAGSRPGRSPFSPNKQPSIYSPELEQAWPDLPVEPPDRFDWYTDDYSLQHLKPPKIPLLSNMTKKHKFAMRTLQMAVRSKSFFS